MPFTPGAQIGPYRIIEQLGQGGMATVYKAYHASLDRYIAVKVLHQAFLEDANFHARFQREARLVARLEHPNIVPIYDYAEHEGQPYLVMKYIEGETLKARMSRGPLSPAETITIIEATGAGLAYAHKQGILHRDIKPSNIILAKDGNIYLADFGLARIAQNAESTLTSDMVLGTPQYISPEQAMSKKELDEGTDIYSFGVVLYEISVGRVPFSADTPFSVIHDHIYAPLPLPSSVNPSVSFDLERVLLKALAKERNDRYASVAELVEAFKLAYGESAPTHAALKPASTTPAEPTPTPTPAPRTAVAAIPSPPPAPAPNAPQKGRRSKWVWILVGILPICLCCLALMAVLDNASNDSPASQVNEQQVQATIVSAILTALPPELAPTAQSALATALPSFSIEEDTTPLEPALPLTAARALVQNDPENPQANFRLVVSLLNENQPTEAYEILKRLAGAANPDEKTLIQRARELERRKHFLAAALIYTRLPENRLKNTPTLRDGLHHSLYLGFAEAIAPDLLPYPTLTNVDEALSIVLQARQALIQRQDPARAQSLLDEARRKNPTLPENELIQAEIFIEQNRLPEARTLLKTLVRPGSSSWVSGYAQGLLNKIK